MNVEQLRKIDFGEIDGYGDPNLEKYFLDNGYWEQIVNDKVFFVVGKKGTGKSAIFRMIENESSKKGAIVVNKDFGEFPFEKLLTLNDDSFSKPNQYQTIWKSVIFNLFIQAIAKLTVENNDYYRQIVAYRDMFLGDAIDLHKDIVSKTTKKEGNLSLQNIIGGVGGIGGSFGSETYQSYKLCNENITIVNSRLSDLIVNYLITTASESKIIIQFDRLDDNYNQYQAIEEYYQAIISLFKVVYNFNQLLRSKNIVNAKVVLYIRSDIIKAIASRDAESARWDDFRFDLNWRVNNMREANQSDLYKMVEKRIHASGREFVGKTFNDIFDIDAKTRKACNIRDLFKSLVLQTLFRPRDLICLLKTLQKEILRAGKFEEPVYKETLKKYSNWLVNTEIANEINPVLRDDYKYVIELLRLCGSKEISVKVFTERYNSVKHTFNLNPLDLLEYLYGVGIIENTWKDKNGTTMHRSIFRNEGDFDRNLQLRIIPSVWSGLTV